MRYLTQPELDRLGDEFQFLRRIRPPRGIPNTFAWYVRQPTPHTAMLLARLRDWVKNPRITRTARLIIYLN